METKKTAIGFETNQGQVYYCLINGVVEIYDAIDMFKKRIVCEDECLLTYDSVDDYLRDDEPFEKENTVCRILKTKMGDIIVKHSEMKGEITYSERYY
jgi:hypothetical protein